jgi:pyruvate/2-oxoglutarate dehydrogenase complex dihydrolipoamide dehydrogenase (E3) component
MNWNFDVLPDDEHNQKLLMNVHPADWKNPEPQPVYNLVVIGAGSAGLIAAIATAGLGGKVALIERHLMGGDCLNVGCVPSKCIIRPARLAAEMKNAAAFGLTPSEIRKDDFPKVMERMRRLRAQFSSDDSARRYREAGVDVFIGEGKFIAPNALEVNGKTLLFKKAVIASGARALHPDFQGLEETGFHTNETIFNLTERPEHLIVIGGGPLGCELAQAFRRLGSEVTIILRSTFLSKEDPEAAELLGKVFQNEDIEVLRHANVQRVEKTAGGRKRVIIQIGGKEKIVEGDEILVGTGRAPNVEDLNLEATGVEYDIHHGVKVNDFLRTTNKRIYAAGDCCMSWKFTHAADAAAQIVVQNALFGGRKKLSGLTMPWCTYTDPEIAHTGLYEDEAAEQGIENETFRFDLSRNGRAEMDGEENGFVKILVKKGTDKIIGATIVAAHAGDLISEISVAMAAGMGLGGIAGVIHPYPTQAEAIKGAAMNWRKTRLTPFVAQLLKSWLRWSLRGL